ncbi:MAG: methylated-DNA--[protein]-cysteine S-methyltransferase [Acidimicrobiales bacterium]
MNRVTRRVASPLGEVVLVGDGQRLHGLYTTGHRRRPTLDTDGVEDGKGDGLADAAEQLAEWFDGRRREFDLELELIGTPFQRRVWDALGEIPFGATVTYGELAARIGRAGSGRAVGHAVGRNPVSIVVPCHRVVGARGVLTGYAGGLDTKQWLLAHEAGRPPNPSNWSGSAPS